MNESWSRRRLLQQFAALSAALVVPSKKLLGEQPTQEPIRDYEIQLTTVSPYTVRLTVLPLTNRKTAGILLHGALVRKSWGPPVVSLRDNARVQTVQSGNLKVRAALDPLSFTISTSAGLEIQTLSADRATGVVS